MSLELEPKKEQTSPTVEPSLATTRDPGVRIPSTVLERLLFVLSRYREASIAAVAVVLVVYFQIGSHGQFIETQFLGVVFRDTGRFGLIAVAEAMLMITAEIDLSVGSTFALAPYTMGLLSVAWGVPLAIGAAVGIALCVLVGVVNGVITVRFRVPSLITTVGTLFFVQGIVVSIYNSQPIMTPVEEPFNEFFGESLYNPRADALLSWHSLTAFSPVLWAIVVVAVMSVVLNRTTFGLHTIATGSNPIGAREIGVRTDRIKVCNFMIAGGLAGFAGIINTLQFSSADPAAGAGFLNLEAIAAAVMGAPRCLAARALRSAR